MTTDLTDRQIKQLLNDLNPARVATRSQGGARLSYLEAWDVRATLIRVFGFGQWSADVIDSEVLKLMEVPPANPQANPQAKPQWVALAKATVRLTIHQTGATYTETASQSQKGPDIGEVTDFALKTAESDALKRAAMNLGTQFGLSLYNNGSVEDVVRVVLESKQAAAIERIRNPKPEPAPDVPAPGEDPRDDLQPQDQALRMGDFGDASHEQPERREPRSRSRQTVLTAPPEDVPMWQAEPR